MIKIFWVLGILVAILILLSSWNLGYKYGQLKLAQSAVGYIKEKEIKIKGEAQDLINDFKQMRGVK